MGAIRPSLIDFEVLPATEDDCLELAQVQSIAFDNAKKEIPGANIFVTMFGPSSEEGNEFRRHGLVEKMKNDPTVRTWKAVLKDDDGKDKIIGWSLWHFFTEPKSVDLLKKDIPWPSTTNAEAANEFIGDAAVVRKRHMDDKRFGCKIWLMGLGCMGLLLIFDRATISCYPPRILWEGRWISAAATRICVCQGVGIDGLLGRCSARWI